MRHDDQKSCIAAPAKIVARFNEPVELLRRSYKSVFCNAAKVANSQAKNTKKVFVPRVKVLLSFGSHGCTPFKPRISGDCMMQGHPQPP